MFLVKDFFLKEYNIFLRFAKANFHSFGKYCLEPVPILNKSKCIYIYTYAVYIYSYIVYRYFHVYLYIYTCVLHKKNRWLSAKNIKFPRSIFLFFGIVLAVQDGGMCLGMDLTVLKVPNPGW